MPPEYLIKCEWLSPLKQGTQASLLKTNQENYDKFVECYLRHNSWVDWQLSNSGDK